MASLFPGYKYDIFISYRQKDNKYDNWVTEFVDHLKKELEATFKEDISIYFDANPQDGLLETHIVDESLSKKLRCLIFIPVISQTYCDPNSFAWQHEFCAFNELAKRDRFGRDIKLAGGDVASRILPVKIHDLDPEDKILLENELGGVLRSIEFIYKSAGVNRPLRANEDHPQDNLNKTYYRDQINKVANAIKEIINGLKHKEEAEVKVLSEEQTSQPVSVPEVNVWWKNKKKIAVALAIVLTLFIGILLLSRYVFVREIEKSIAVLPFKNDSPVDSNKYFINGIKEEVLNNLQSINDLRVLSRTSVEQYINTTKSIPEIARELGVNYIVEGSGQKVGKNFRLRVQLISAKGKEDHIWAKSYEQEIQNTNDVFKIQSEIAQAIAKELQITITPEEEQLTEKKPTSNLDALYFYQKGNEEIRKLIPLMSNRQNPLILINNKRALVSAKKMFIKALEYDSTFALAYTGLARTGINLDSMLILADKALYYDNQVADAYIIRGDYFRSVGDKNRAFNEYDEALKIQPNSWEAYFQKGKFYNIDDDLLKSIDNLQKAASLNLGSELADIKYEISRSYRYAGFYDKSNEAALESLKLDGDSVRYLINLASCETNRGFIKKGIDLLKKGYAIDSTNIRIWFNLGQSYLFSHQWEESLIFYKKYNAFQTLVRHHLQCLGYAYLKNGYTKEAESCFDRVMKDCENQIKLGKQTNFTYYLLANFYAFRGDKGKVYENLKHYSQVQNISNFYIDYLEYHPWFDSIRDEPEFKKIYMEMEAKFHAQHERIRKWLEENNML